VQHTPGVVCLQDISNLMSKIRSSSSSSTASSSNNLNRKQTSQLSANSYVNTLLSHSAYPSTYAYPKGIMTYGEGEQGGIGESEQFLKRYSTSSK